MPHFKATAEGMIPFTEEEEAENLAGQAESTRRLMEHLSFRIREERNAKLATSDWTQVLDVPEATRSAWITYRQALRDITAQPEFPALPMEIVWPSPP